MVNRHRLIDLTGEITLKLRGVVPIKRKLIVISGILILIAAMLGIDYFRMKQVEIQVLSVSPSPAPASSDENVEIRVRVVRKGGQPVAGHLLYALSLGGGDFQSFYVKTDGDGYAKFIYYPYDLPSYQKPRDVEIEIRDESNSIFIEMYPKVRYTIKMVAPENSDSYGLIVDDFFD